MSGVLRDFPANQQRLQVFDNTIVFNILPDVTPEGEETVEISSEPVDNPLPAYSRPQTHTTITIIILDDDSKKNDHKLYLQ